MQEQTRLRKEVVRLKREMNAISAQDDFARWAKIRRQHDKALEEHDKKGTFSVVVRVQIPQTHLHTWLFCLPCLRLLSAFPSSPSRPVTPRSLAIRSTRLTVWGGFLFAFSSGQCLIIKRFLRHQSRHSPLAIYERTAVRPAVLARKDPRLHVPARMVPVVRRVGSRVSQVSLRRRQYQRLEHGLWHGDCARLGPDCLHCALRARVRGSERCRWGQAEGESACCCWEEFMKEVGWIVFATHMARLITKTANMQKQVGEINCMCDSSPTTILNASCLCNGQIGPLVVHQVFTIVARQ